MKDIFTQIAVAVVAATSLLAQPAEAGTLTIADGFGAPIGSAPSLPVDARDIALQGRRPDSMRALVEIPAFDAARAATARMDDDDDDDDEDEVDNRRAAAAARYKQRKAARDKMSAAAAERARRELKAKSAQPMRPTTAQVPLTPARPAAPRTAEVTLPSVTPAVAPGPAPKAARPSGACKRFLPGAGITVSVPCTEEF
jgi:hypothetical protein